VRTLGPLLGALLLAAPASAGKSQTRLEGGYSFINPLLECEDAENRELLPFRHKVQEAVDKALQQRKATHVSVYFRDLNNGPWIGVNESELFTPASLLKLPVLMAIFRAEEDEPGLLEEKIFFAGPRRPGEVHFDPKSLIEPGRDYTVEELARRMIVHSDNSAAALLYQRLGREKMSSTFKGLGLELRPHKEGADFISVKEYASFFRILYNATYLSRDMSEKALGWLAQSDFPEGIVAGVPPGIVVAHKFGERTVKSTYQLHDCGIVYWQGRPYLLGVMTRGKDMNELAGVIAGVSRLIFTEVEKQFPRPKAK
jgi:beta-lactamase class A